MYHKGWISARESTIGSLYEEVSPILYAAIQAIRGATTTGHEAKDIHHDHLNSHHRTGYDHGGNPLAHAATNDPSRSLPAFGGYFQPGLYA